MTPIVAYFRVSTDKQAKSGLGLEAQQSAVEAYAQRNNGKLLAHYVEAESGKIADRPQLGKALAHARRARATLVVAKLDRLARNVKFLATLMDSDVPFVATDNASANRLTLHILAAVAEAECKAISERTKVALAAYKARGGLLGAALPQCRNNLSREAAIAGREAGRRARSAAAEAQRREIVPVISELRAQGLTLEAIAEELNQKGWKAPRGGQWRKQHVSRFLQHTQA